MSFSLKVIKRKDNFYQTDIEGNFYDATIENKLNQFTSVKVQSKPDANC